MESGGWEGEGCLELLIFSSIFGLYPLDASIISLLVVAITNSSRHCQMSPGKQKYSGVRTTILQNTEKYNKKNIITK